MRKTFLAIAAVAACLTSSAQDLMSKKGEAFLPEAGDYAIGFDAVPLLNVFKFNNDDKVNAGFAPVTGESNQAGIMIKRFTAAKAATRYGIRVNWSNSFAKAEVPEMNGGVENPGQTVENRTKQSSFDAFLSMGKEMRRGNTRVQGYHGVEALINLGGSKTTYDYGNDFADMADSTYIEKIRSGTRFGLGARIFLGVEYFIAPKISINAEYGLAAMFSTTGRGKVERTTVVNQDDNSETVEGSSRTSAFNLGTDISQGAIRILFHF